MFIPASGGQAIVGELSHPPTLAGLFDIKDPPTTYIHTAVTLLIDFTGRFRKTPKPDSSPQ